ncbi:hypothetical protein DESUT3_34450 [Desulfuromonas versatilis]|uniref:Methyl-accepting chemotaxis sensory transducer n=1 Tax=Desulfuromonas versatilis TaxID=2802975 RepID=A0ABN6E220_9BACT|nr:methyl-accepting chemotaxis protein [Desulfuromonas versatilis]BCR06376.1 hypothetical protein DESUT3_34450 [Desulfuromonas versatilis]
MKVSTRITAICLGLVLLTALAIVGVTIYQENSLQKSIRGEMDLVIRSEAQKIAQDVYLMARSAHESVQQTVGYSLKVGHSLLQQYGAVSFGERLVDWQATNQLTKATTRLQLPEMLVGSTWLGQNSEIAQATPVVDEVLKLTGATCTIFQRMNPAGDMLRVATNVETLDGTRAIGTFIPAVNPDGRKNPVIESVLRGETFRGRAFVVNAWYITAYEPIWNAARDQVIGILYVGEKQENITSLRHGVMDIVVGKTGYVSILGGSGEQQGQYLISKGGLRDGENIWEARDAEGRLFIQSIIEKARGLEASSGSGAIPVAFERYPWKNEGESRARSKVAAITYYAPWDWVIIAGLYEDDFSEMTERVNGAFARMTKAIAAIAAVVTLLGFVLAWLTGRNLSRPLVATVAMLQDLEAGRLERRLNLKRSDEIGQMAATMDAFADNLQNEVILALQKLAGGDLTFAVQPRDEKDVIRGALKTLGDDLNSLVGQIQIAGEQIASGAVQVSDSSQSLSQGATQSASSIEEISSSLTEITARTQASSENAGQARQLTGQVRQSAEGGNSQMQTMVAAMTDINEAGQNISKIIKTIDEIAFQTNLLALNAAVEAARAGQHGKGFAVVAEEVRNLAARSARAARETADLIQASVEKTARGSEIAQQTAATFAEIVTGIGRASQLAAEIAQAADDQAQGLSQINIGLEQIDQVTQQNTANAEESASAAEELSGQAVCLREMLSRFKVRNGQDAVAGDRAPRGARPAEDSEGWNLLPGPRD